MIANAPKSYGRGLAFWVHASDLSLSFLAS
jgi:hypothetical protein